MRILAAVALGVIAFAAGMLLGLGLDADDAPATSASGLPAAVEETRAALLEAAESGDYEALRRLLPDELEFTFGGPVEGGPIAYWQELERTTGERPLDSSRRSGP